MTRLASRPMPQRSRRALLGNPVYKALAAKPMAASIQLDQAIDVRMAFEQVVQGKATWSDRQSIAGVSNCVAMLAATHCVPADQAAAEAAQMAILRADARLLHGGASTWNFDGPGRQAVLQMLDIFEQLIAQLGRLQVIEALISVIDHVKRGHTHQIVPTQKAAQ